MCEEGSGSLRLSMWGSRSKWLRVVERQKVTAELLEVGKNKKKTKVSIKNDH